MLNCLEKHRHGKEDVAIHFGKPLMQQLGVIDIRQIFPVKNLSDFLSVW